ncbi:hypothetical protein C8R45DRAFT_945015 [Mycena sanguinolenta]|nr:hypothetical protein C8R45DRAFT_945015 [Mycena sanguinolenta]
MGWSRGLARSSSRPRRASWLGETPRRRGWNKLVSSGVDASGEKPHYVEQNASPVDARVIAHPSGLYQIGWGSPKCDMEMNPLAQIVAKKPQAATCNINCPGMTFPGGPKSFLTNAPSEKLFLLEIIRLPARTEASLIPASVKHLFSGTIRTTSVGAGICWIHGWDSQLLPGEYMINAEKARARSSELPQLGNVRDTRPSQKRLAPLGATMALPGVGRNRSSQINISLKGGNIVHCECKKLGYLHIKRDDDVGFGLDPIRGGTISVQCWKRCVTRGSKRAKQEQIHITARPIQHIRSNTAANPRDQQRFT